MCCSKKLTAGVGAIIIGCALQTASPAGDPGLDGRVSAFLSESRGSWSDWNVPYEDGEILYGLVLKGNFRRILEIGTSTGHSTVWLAWAASKTGGKVTTIEVDRGRYEKARANFEKAGVSPYIDARLADAHDLVPSLAGPFDFVFCDADKEWYLRYFEDLRARIAPAGCFAAHNVLWAHNPDIARFLRYVRQAPGFRTTVEKGSGEGISISCKAPPS